MHMAAHWPIAWCAREPVSLPLSAWLQVNLVPEYQGLLNEYEIDTGH